MVAGFIPDTLLLAVLVSTVLAGMRRSTGQTFQTSTIRNGLGVQAMGIFLGVGEWVMDRLTGYAKGSRFFAYDPNVAIAGVKNQATEFTDDIKAAINEFKKAD